jgi:hypothetical protein
MNFNDSKTLQELENSDWGELPPGPPPHWDLEKTVYKLRRVPLNQFTAEDIRLMLGQNVGLDFMMPLAIERLKVNPWKPDDSRGGRAGDLLRFVLTDRLGDKRRFWEGHPESWTTMRAVCETALAQMPRLSDWDRSIVTERWNIGPTEDPSVVELLNAALSIDSFAEDPAQGSP